MRYGHDGKFYVEYDSCIRPAGSLRSESDARARDLYATNNKIIICTSSGLDSQTALFSFKNQSIPVECAFMYMEGYNDNEYEHIKLLEKKYGHKTEIILIDPIKLKDECISIAEQYDTNPYHALHYKFIEQLPKEYDVVQAIHDPWIITHNNKHYIFNSFYDPEISRYETLIKVPRSGKIQMFGDSSEFFLSSISDPLFDYFLKSHTYFNGNSYMPMHDVYRYEYYIKPLLYAKHWGDELFYFPKFAGYENISWLRERLTEPKKKKLCAIERNELINFFKNGTGSKRVYETIAK